MNKLWLSDLLKSLQSGETFCCILERLNFRLLTISTIHGNLNFLCLCKVDGPKTNKTGSKTCITVLISRCHTIPFNAGSKSSFGGTKLLTKSFHRLFCYFQVRCHKFPSLVNNSWMDGDKSTKFHTQRDKKRVAQLNLGVVINFAPAAFGSISWVQCCSCWETQVPWHSAESRIELGLRHSKLQLEPLST